MMFRRRTAEQEHVRQEILYREWMRDEARFARLVDRFWRALGMPMGTVGRSALEMILNQADHRTANDAIEMLLRERAYLKAKGA